MLARWAGAAAGHRRLGRALPPTSALLRAAVPTAAALPPDVLLQPRWHDVQQRRHAGSSSGSPPDFAFSMTDATKVLPGGRVLLDQVSLSFYQGAKIGILGPNGAGKSSFLKLIAGEDQDFDGQVWVSDRVQLGYLPQEPRLDPEKDVFGNIVEGIGERWQLVERFDEINAALEAGDWEHLGGDAVFEEQIELTEKIEAAQAWNIKAEAQTAMAALRCPAPDADVTALSGGEARRVALCRLLLSRPDALLLDEPTNHLDAWSVSWIEDYLARYKGTVLAITHDRYFLDNVADWILEIDSGRAMPHEGNYSSWMAAKHKRLRLDNLAEARQKKAMGRELEWIRSNAKGGRTKSKARTAAFEQMQSEQRGLAAAERLQSGAIVLPPGPRLGNDVLELKGVAKTYPTRGRLFKDFSFKMTNKMRVGIVGSNGSGKSTLLRLIAGEETSDDGGTVRRGDTVHLGSVTQNRTLDPKNSVYEEVSGGDEFIDVDGEAIPLRAYVASFNLRGPVQEKNIGALSGGERNRVHIAKQLKQGYNVRVWVLLLDEPTNDLDVATLRSLEDALAHYPGAVVIVSHDRWFLNRVATDIIAFEQPGEAPYVFHGNFEEYERDVKRRGGDAGVELTQNQKNS